MRLFAIVIVMSLCIGGLAEAATAVGTAAAVHGNVQLQRGGKKYRMKQGTELFNGDSIVTAADSFAKLLMKDDSVLTVGARSNFLIQNFSTSDGRVALYRLWFGKMRAVISKHVGGRNDVRFSTPTAVAGVRGTHFLLQYDHATKKTTLSVIEGEVAFNALDRAGLSPVVVRTRQRTHYQPGASMGSVQGISDTDMKDLDGEISQQRGGGEATGDNQGDDDGAPSGGASSTPGAGGGTDEQEQGGIPAPESDRTDDALDRVNDVARDVDGTLDLPPAENPAANTPGSIRVRW